MSEFSFPPSVPADEIADRIAYAGLPWVQRLVTTPPPGWPGGHLARALAWGVQIVPRRAALHGEAVSDGMEV